MTKPLPELGFLYEALSAEFGMLFTTSDIEYARKRFIRAQRESGDPALADLQILPLTGDRVIAGANLAIVKPGVIARAEEEKWTNPQGN